MIIILMASLYKYVDRRIVKFVYNLAQFSYEFFIKMMSLYFFVFFIMSILQPLNILRSLIIFVIFISVSFIAYHCTSFYEWLVNTMEFFIIKII